jgi:hypothetical protein
MGKYLKLLCVEGYFGLDFAWDYPPKTCKLGLLWGKPIHLQKTGYGLDSRSSV